MKKVFLSISFVAFSLMALMGQSAAKVKWVTFAEAQKLQQTAPRKVLMDIYTDWCGWCKRMDAETFNNPVIAEYINAHFYAVKFNAEGTDSIRYNNYTFTNQGGGQRSTHQFAMALFNAQKMSAGYPSIAYFDEKMQLISVVSGYKKPVEMEVWLNYLVEDKYKPTPLDEYRATFKSKLPK
jgi:thioredoxin-related protein